MVGLQLGVLRMPLRRTLLLSSDQRMNFRGAAELLSGDDKAMQANNLAGLNECAADPWLSVPLKHWHTCMACLLRASARHQLCSVSICKAVLAEGEDGD